MALEKEWNLFANAIGQREMPRADYILGGYNYRIPLPGAIFKEDKLYANVAFPGLTIHYTTDGSDPTYNSEIYVQPVNVNGVIKLRTFDSRGRGSRISVVQSN